MITIRFYKKEATVLERVETIDIKINNINYVLTIWNLDKFIEIMNEVLVLSSLSDMFIDIQYNYHPSCSVDNKLNQTYKRILKAIQQK